MDIEDEYTSEYDYNDAGGIPTLMIPSTLSTNNGWNDSIEHDAKVIAEKSGGLRWMHNQSSSVFQKRYWMVTGINIFLSALVVAFNSITGAECINENFSPYRVTSIIGAAILGVATTYAGVKNYGSRVTAHQVIEGNLQALFYTIKNQLNLNRRDRQFGKDFLEWVQKEYTDLSTNPDSPDIPDFIEEKYKKIIDGSNIASHNDPIEAIVIKQESPPRNNPINSYNNARLRSYNPTRGTNDYATHATHNLRPLLKRPVSAPVNFEGVDSDTEKMTNEVDSEDNFTVSIPNTGLSLKEKWQLSRFYGNK